MAPTPPGARRAALLCLFGVAAGFGAPVVYPRPAFARSTRALPHFGAARVQAAPVCTAPLALRGGGAASLLPASLVASPSALFNTVFAVLVTATVVCKLSLRQPADPARAERANPAVRALQLRFLPVFWLLRMADWLQGPYFYEVYASKVFGGQKASLDLISKLFLTGFGATAVFGPAAGRLCDQRGRKLGTLLFAAFYTVGALSTRSALLWVLLLGRLAGGIGTSLLFSAPEAWLVGEAQRTKTTDALGETFGQAYAGDAIVAIVAGQLAGAAASSRGPSGPFELSVGFLAAGAALAGVKWRENRGQAEGAAATEGCTIGDAARVVRADRRVMLVGAVQALFEGAMYIFVLQWPPAISSAVGRAFGGASTPYGTIFSCFMACCLLGSTAFGALVRRGVRTEASTLVMLALATAAMGSAALGSLGAAAPLGALAAAFFAFEACVGMYFPSIGSLRSKYLPEAQRTVIMNLFGIPLNVIVVAVFLSIKRLGVSGALAIASGALGLATLAMAALASIGPASAEQPAAEAA